VVDESTAPGKNVPWFTRGLAHGQHFTGSYVLLVVCHSKMGLEHAFDGLPSTVSSIP
jgi:hypothetical protein